MSLKKNKRNVNDTNQRKKILYRYYEKSLLEFHLCPLKIFIYDKILIKVVLFCVLFYFIVVQKIANIIKNIFNPNKKFSDKWIVMTTINPPNKTIDSLLKFLDNWKIVVVADKKTNDDNWKQFINSDQLFYLSLKDQYNLNYRILKYIPTNSYSRKNIGYLYAIHHGAKEIFEINDNIIDNFKYLNWKDNKNIFDRIIVCNNHNSKMINPFSYFGINDIWPRGFVYKNISIDDNEYLNLASSQVKLNPLVYQGIINGKPDVDSIFLLTRIGKNQNLDINFSEQNPLFYLPGNYVPINSKNTKYLYDVFPLLPLPTTTNKKISDIIRGYIMQYYSWRYNGGVIYLSSDAYKKGYNNATLSDLIEEKNLYYKIGELLDILKDEIFYEINEPIKLIINIIEKLVSREILGKNDLKMYKAYIKDLSHFGFIFSSTFQNYKNINDNDYYSKHSELYCKDVLQPKVILKNNGNTILFKHKYSNKVYNDILLAINYNYNKLVKLNEYFMQLYCKYFPNIIFIYPGNELNINNSIACPESDRGVYAYMCFRKVYKKYPNFKGYLIIDDDNLMKPWDFQNFDSNIPWTNIFNLRRILVGCFKNSYIYFDNLIKNNREWHDNLVKYVGSYSIPQLWAEVVYIPNSLMIKFCDIVEPMYNQRIFLEIAIPMTFSQLRLDKYKICNSILIWYEKNAHMIEYLRNSSGITFVHPLKLSEAILQKVVRQYIFFINAQEY